MWYLWSRAASRLPCYPTFRPRNRRKSHHARNWSPPAHLYGFTKNRKTTWPTSMFITFLSQFLHKVEHVMSYSKHFRDLKYWPLRTTLRISINGQAIKLVTPNFQKFFWGVLLHRSHSGHMQPRTVPCISTPQMVDLGFSFRLRIGERCSRPFTIKSTEVATPPVDLRFCWPGMDREIRE